MGYAPSRRTQLAYKQHATNYDTTETGTSGFTVLESAIPKFTPALEAPRRDPIRSGFFELSPIVGSTHGGTLTVQVPLLGVDASTPSADPTRHFLAYALEQLMGGVSIGGYAASALVAWANTTIQIDNGVASSVYAAGEAIVGQVQDSSYEMAVLTDVTDGGPAEHTLTSLFPLQGTSPGADDKSYGTVGCHISDGAPTALTFRLQQANTTGLLVLGGCVCTNAKFNAAPKAVPTVELTFLVNDVREDVGNGAALSATAYTLPTIKNPSAKNGGRLVLGTSEAAFQTLSIDISQTLMAVEDHNARTGVANVVPVDRMVKMDFQRITTGALTDLASLSNPSKIGLFMGTAPGAMVGFVMPAPVLIGPATVDDASGVAAQSFSVAAGQYTGDTGSTAPADSPFRIYFG